MYFSFLGRIYASTSENSYIIIILIINNATGEQRANVSLLQENSVLVLVLRMLALGLHSWDMIESQVFREPKLDPQIVTKFLPSLVSLMVDDEVRKLNSKLPLDERETAIAVIEHSGEWGRVAVGWGGVSLVKNVRFSILVIFIENKTLFSFFYHLTKKNSLSISFFLIIELYQYTKTQNVEVATCNSNIEERSQP